MRTANPQELSVMEMFVTRLKPDDDIGGSLNMICFRVFNFVLENAWYRCIDR
jgi:hypothetical protein